jgi:DNA invertase Pin-like site-specific DNA recombinase
MNIAFYGRYSSDNQKETSIEDQRRVVDRWAERQGHTIVVEFADAAVSGANAKIRKGLQAALKTALSRPRRFEAIAVDQLSRLSRDVGDTDAIVKRLRFSGVRVIAVAEGIDTADETTKISVTVKSLVNELYLDDLRKTTKRGLDGQFLKDFSTGGRTYGYRSQPVHDPSGRADPWGNPVPIGYRLTVHPDEATVVREIFRLFAEGYGEKAIAKDLNGRRHTARIWRPNTIYFMLQNSRYVGQFYFNRREWRKNPETGRRVYRWRPKDQWESRSIEALRIVDTATWEAVQYRLQNRRHLFVNGPSAIYLLSGFLICDRCGGPLTLISNCYGCKNRAESGTCQNYIRARRESVEWLVIGELARRLSTIADGIRRAATRDVASQLTAPPATTHDLRDEAEAVMKAIRDGRLSGRALEEALHTYQTLWDRIELLERQPTTGANQSTPSVIQYDQSVVDDFLSHLPEAVQVDISLGREFLRDFISEVRIADEEPRPTICPLCGKTLGKLTPQHMRRHALSLEEVYRRFPQLGFNRKARLVIQPGPHSLFPALEVRDEVAGDGFEPSTFGL